MQDDFPLTRSKVTVRTILMRREIASRDDSVIKTVKCLPFSPFVEARFSVSTCK